MKKILAILTAMLMAIAASAEEADLFVQLEGQLFEFTSGAGGWSTEMLIGENGAFSGYYHDSEMGETGEGYPDGTVYVCRFHGVFSDPRMEDEYTWSMKMAVETEEGQAPETIDGGIRYVASPPYGVEKAQSVVLYLPGTPVDRLPEGFMIWSHLQEIDPEAETIPYYAIWNETDGAGFITDPAAAERDGIESTERTEDDSDEHQKI